MTEPAILPPLLTGICPICGTDQLTAERSGRLDGDTNGFGYDTSGNPTTWKGAPQTFNGDNQNTAGTYDNDGNPTSWQGNALSFDAENHLTAVGNLLTAGYNAEGLRVWKQSSAGTTYFLYDGLTPIAEVDQNANVTAINTWGVAGLASRRTVSGNRSVFYTFDVQGGTAQRLDSGGNLLGSYGFDAFGTRASTDNSSDPYSGFGAQWGYYRDSETGLSLLGHRYYDPGQGRFLNRDPIGYDGGLNLYGYVGSNPTGGIDLDGFIAVYFHPSRPYDPQIDGSKPLPGWWNGMVWQYHHSLLGQLVGIANDKAQECLSTVNHAFDPVAGIAGEPEARPWKEDAWHGTKPKYTNPGHHDPTSPNFRGRGDTTSTLPGDAEEVYEKNAIPDPASNGKNWYGRNADGTYYRYQESNGKVHWNGLDNSPRGLQVPSYIRRRFERR